MRLRRFNNDDDNNEKKKKDDEESKLIGKGVSQIQWLGRVHRVSVLDRAQLDGSLGSSYFRFGVGRVLG